MEVSKEHRIAILEFYIEHANDKEVLLGLCAALADIANILFGYDYYEFEVDKVYPLFKSVCKQFSGNIYEGGFWWPASDRDTRIGVCKKLLEIEKRNEE